MTKSFSLYAIAALALALSASGCHCPGPGRQKAYGEIRVVYEDNGVTVAGETGTYDFGTVSMGKTVTLKVRIQNTGRGTLTVEKFEKVDGAPVELGTTTVEAAAVFKLDYEALSDIPTGETREFTLSFMPPLDAVNKKVEWRADLMLHALNTDTGKDTAAILVKGTAISGVCDLPKTIDFGAVARGDTYQQVVSLKNDQPIDTLASVGPIISAQGETVFTYTPDSPQGEFTLSSGKTREVVITFAPTEGRDYFGTATMRAAEGCPEVKVRLVGTGVDQVLSWAPSTVDFGYVTPMLTAAADVTFSNQAIHDVTLSAMGTYEGSNPSNVFKVTATGTADLTKLVVPAGARDPATGTITPGTVKASLSFRPQVLGVKPGLLKAATDLRSQATIAVPLRGVGGGPAIDVKPSPLLNFGRVAFFAGANPASYATRRVTVQNVGTRPNPPDARANLRLGDKGNGAPYWKVEPRSAASGADEICVGLFDVGTQTCVGQLPTTGPGAYDPAKGLEASGASAMLDIPIRVTPTSIGQKEWDLTFFSNDPRNPEVKVTIQANAVTLPPCNYSVRPLNLNFGVVTPPSTKDLAFEIKNNSPTDLCLISNLDMRAGSDPMFLLPAGVQPETELQGGQAMVVMVRSWPQGQLPQTPTQVTGAVLFNVSSPSAPQQTVNLQATLAASCLTISPSDLDFGTVKVGCNSPDKTFQIYNTCSQPITVLSSTMLAPAGLPANTPPDCNQATACPEFIAVGAPAPGPIAAGNSIAVVFNLKYHPINLGQDQGAYLIKVNQGGQTVDYVVTLRGKGDTDGTNTDTFRQDSKPKADILLVVDNSCSMADKQAALAANFGSFIKYATASQVDFQIGITTTDMDVEAGKLVASASGVKIFRSTTANLEQQFGQTINLGTDGSSTETCLEPAAKALTAPLISDPASNLGLLRPDAVLAVVCVTDAVDQSSQPAAYYLNQLVNIKGAQRPGAFTYNVVGPFNSPTGSCTYDSVADDGKHAFMVAQTNGVKEEICTADWAKALENIGKGAFGYRTNFYLTARPSGPATVEINGVVLDPVEPTRHAKVWDYDPATNSINFQPLYVPQPGDTLTVTYQVACILTP